MTNIGLVVAEFEEHATVIDEMAAEATAAAAERGATVVESVRRGRAIARPSVGSVGSLWDHCGLRDP